MKIGMRFSTRVIGCTTLLMVCLSVAQQRQAVSTSPGESPAARAPEVRLRKLHLVRPDLIPYPVAYEVYC
jgi:hypothetical protein